jgi:hypothetical protein
MRRVLFDLSLTTSVYNFLIVHFPDACFYYFCFDYFCKHVHCPRSDCMIMILCICKIKPILFYSINKKLQNLSCSLVCNWKVCTKSFKFRNSHAYLKDAKN